MVSTSPTVHPSPSPHEQHTDSTMLPPLMPEPSPPSSSCGAIRSPWRHSDSEGGNHPPPMPVRSPWARIARQRWAASSTIHPRARMATFRKTPSPREQHTDSTMIRKEKISLFIVWIIQYYSYLCIMNCHRRFIKLHTVQLS